MWDRMCNEDYGHYTGCMDGSVEDQHTLVDVSSHVDMLPPDDDVSRTDDNDEATNRYYDKIIIITVYLSFSPPSLSLSLSASLPLLPPIFLYLSHCFLPVSPAAGSSNFSFSYLPFVDPSTYYCPDLNKGYNKFGGLQSDSETQDEVSSFSTLPTSLFALKPSRHGPAPPGLSEKPSADKERTPSDQEKETSSQEKPPVPPTHLSLVGLPVQIHVGNLKHLPKKDIPTPSASDTPPLPPPPPPLPVPSTPVSHSSSDTGLPSSSSNDVLPPLPPPPVEWQTSHPSSFISSLDKPVKRTGMLSWRNRSLTSQMVTDITSQLKASLSVHPTKSDPPPLPPLPPPPPPPPPTAAAAAATAALLTLQQQAPLPPPSPQVTALSTTAPVATSATSTVHPPPLSLPLVANRTSSLPSNSSISPLPLQTKLVSGLMLDQRTVVETALAAREKALAPIVHHNSPNGSVHDLFHHAKLQAEAEKHALAAG